MPAIPDSGCEYLIDATGCDPRRLVDVALLHRLIETIVDELELNPVKPGVWHQFPGHAGVTGMVLLSESHLTVHTWPEFGLAAFNLFSCQPRPPWPWAERLRDELGAKQVKVVCVERAVRKEAGP